MANKNGFILRIDLWAAKKGPKWKIMWQLVKYAIVSSLAGIIQLLLVNILFHALSNWTPPLSPLLKNIFSEEVVGSENSNWGYVLTFFISNAVANTFAYFLNKKKTFKSDAPVYHFIIYIIVVILLVFLMTWLSGAMVHAITSLNKNLKEIAPTFATLSTSFLQGILLFPLQKFVLSRESKNEVLKEKEVESNID